MTSSALLTYAAPPPNTDEGYIADLKFGRKDYEEERDQWYTTRNDLLRKLQKEQKYKSLSSSIIRRIINDKIPPWRQTLTPPDKLALIPIWENTIEYLKPGSYVKQYTQYWCPRLMENTILSDPAIVRSVFFSAKKNFPYGCEQKVSRAILEFFVSSYKEELFKQNCKYEECWQKAVILFRERGSVIVARWCLEQFCSEDISWVSALANCGGLSPSSSHSVAISKHDEDCSMVLADVEDDEEDKKEVETYKEEYEDDGLEFDD